MADPAIEFTRDMFSLPGYFKIKERLQNATLYFCVALECDMPILEAIFIPTIWRYENVGFRLSILSGNLQTARHIWENSDRIQILFSNFVLCLPSYMTLGNDTVRLVEINTLKLTDNEKISEFFKRFLNDRDKSPVRGPKKN